MANHKELNTKAAIDNQLIRIADTLMLNASFIDNPGLLNGKMGIAIFFYHFSRYTGSKIYNDYAGELIDEIYEETNTNTPVNFENGLTGIGWGIEYLVKNGFIKCDTDVTLSEIDTIVFRNSLYRPFLLESDNDLFGYGLYYIVRLRERGNDDNNLITLFKKQHLIYLLNDCERILIKKKFLDFNIESLKSESLNSFLWFLLEMYQWKIFPFKVEKLMNSLPELITNCLSKPNEVSSKRQLISLSGSIIQYIRDRNLQDTLKESIRIISTSIYGKDNLIEDSILVQNFIDRTWHTLIYDPYVQNVAGSELSNRKVINLIINEENWKNRLDNLNKNNLGLTSLTGIGLGLLFILQKENLKEIQL